MNKLNKPDARAALSKIRYGLLIKDKFQMKVCYAAFVTALGDEGEYYAEVSKKLAEAIEVFDLSEIDAGCRLLNSMLGPVTYGELKTGALFEAKGFNGVLLKRAVGAKYLADSVTQPHLPADTIVFPLES